MIKLKIFLSMKNLKNLHFFIKNFLNLNFYNANKNLLNVIYNETFLLLKIS
jgi:hypothetical protein